MPYVNTRKMLLKAQSEGYAIGAFNIENMEFVQAAIEAAEEMESPIILATSVNTLKYASSNIFSSMVKSTCENSEIPVALHLDYGESYQDVIGVIKSGYLSAMIDGSKLTYLENVELTAKVTALCGNFDITVEGELGAIGGKPGDLRVEELMYTDPETANDFVRNTKVDSLAVAVGTAHGKYKSTPKLDINRLDQIRKKVDVPLVLHGASGLNDNQIRSCIKNGICKINIATELRCIWTQAIKKSYAETPDIYDPKNAAGEARKAVKELIKKKISLFGSEGKAK